MERLDQYEINDIVERVKADGYGLRPLFSSAHSETDHVEQAESPIACPVT